MNYNSMTKAQLIEHIEKLESLTLQARWKTVQSEAKLAWGDLIKLTEWIYNAGVESRKAVNALFAPVVITH